MKIICVPKDLGALHRLDYDLHRPEDLFEVILDNDVFALLWKQGFFDAINRLAGSIIDDFEDEVITNADMIKRVLQSNILRKTMTRIYT